LGGRRGEFDEEIELIVLRDRLTVLRRQGERRKLEPADRALSPRSRLLLSRRRDRFAVTPRTLRRWHRELLRRKWPQSLARRGCPPLDAALRQLLLRVRAGNSVDSRGLPKSGARPSKSHDSQAAR